MSICDRTLGLTCMQLLAAGRMVVAAVRSDSKAEILSDAANDAPSRLFVRSGVDITNPDTLTSQLLEGVTQIVLAVGPVFGRTPEGQMGCVCRPRIV